MGRGSRGIFSGVREKGVVGCRLPIPQRMATPTIRATRPPHTTARAIHPSAARVMGSTRNRCTW